MMLKLSKHRSVFICFLSDNFDESMNIRSLVKSRADLCVTKNVLQSLLYLNTNRANLSSDSFKALSFIFTFDKVEMFFDPFQDLSTILKAIEDFFENVSKYQARDVRPGLRLIETLITPKPQVHRSISDRILRPLVCLFRGYPFDVEASVVSRTLKIIRDILTRSSAICVSTFFSNSDNSGDIEHLKKNLLELDSRKILNEILAFNQSLKPSGAPKMTFRRQASAPANTIRAKLVDDDTPRNVSPSPDISSRQQFSAPAIPRPHSNNVPLNKPPLDNCIPPTKRVNPHSSSQVTSKPVFRSLQPEAGPVASKSVSVGEKLEIKPEEIVRLSNKFTVINENVILDDAVQIFQQNYHNSDEKYADEDENEVESPTVAEARRGLFEWMIDKDSYSSTDEDIQELLKTTNNDTYEEQSRHEHSGIKGDIDMEELDQWNDDDGFVKTFQFQKPVKDTISVKKLETPTCSQLTKNHLLSVKHSIKVELCETEKFIDIDAEFLTTRICGMLNTVNGGAIYLGVKRNGVIKGVRMDRKQKDKVKVWGGYGHFDEYFCFCQTRQLLDRVLCYHLVPRVVAACADIEFVEVVDHSYRDVPLCVVVVTVRGEVRAGEDPKFAVCSFPHQQVNGHYVRRGTDPDYNVKIR